jgi:intein/homing endonuclease
MTKRSLNIIREYRNYLWDTDREGKIINVPSPGFDHCLVGDTNILMANGGKKNIKNIKIGDEVITDKGVNKVVASWLDAKNVPIYEITLSNGYRLKGTGRHKIYTERGKIAIDALRHDDIIKVLNYKQISSWKKQLFILGKDLTGTVNTIASLVEEKDCTKLFTNKFLVLSQKDTTSTTLIKTEQITKLVILNLLKRQSIYQNIIKKIGKTKILEKELGKIVRGLDILRKNGINQKKVKNGTLNTVKKLGQTKNKLKRFAKYAEKNIKHFSQNVQNFAITIVKRKRCGKADVYNLTIDREHNYFANGILVGNSADAIRYGLESYRPVNIVFKNRVLATRLNKINNKDA